MVKFHVKLVLYLILLFMFRANADHDKFEEVICRSTTIQSVEDFNKLAECTLMVGHIRIVQMTFIHSDLSRLKPSKIEEITDYLLVYRADGLDSLERLFPKLIIIRGMELFHNEYSLIVLENVDLKNIGLISLRRVLEGSIRIEFNPSLCFVHTIDWVMILGKELRKKYTFVTRNNKAIIECPLCYSVLDSDTEIEVKRHRECWSLGKFQYLTKDYSNGMACCNPSDEYAQTVTASNGQTKCPPQTEPIYCINGCENEGCNRCTHSVTDKGCVQYCLPHRYYTALNRQCVTRCADLNLVQLARTCVEKCPKFYRPVTHFDETICTLNCTGNFEINYASDLKGLSECTTIDGSLIINLRDAKEAVVEELEVMFYNLNEITGYLKIINSQPIVSLHFFRNLHTIRGSQLVENRYSVYVVGNDYLQELWTPNVAIINGCVYFHLNPRLCYDKIAQLENHFRTCPKISVKDVSRHSNGDKVVCGEKVSKFNATITSINATAATIEVDLLPRGAIYILVGYVYYYKEAPYRNVTKYDGRHGCGWDRWITEPIATFRRRHMLKNLKPNTQYAYFVNSLTMFDLFGYELVSDINYFTTLPAKPEKVAKLYYNTISPTEVDIHWWPPLFTNGVLDKYVVLHKETNTSTFIQGPETNEEKDCQCPKLHTDSNIPTPFVEDYYNTESATYLDTVLNFMFVKRPETKANETKTTNTTNTSNETNEIDTTANEINTTANEINTTTNETNSTSNETNTPNNRSGDTSKQPEVIKINETKQTNETNETYESTEISDDNIGNKTEKKMSKEEAEMRERFNKAMLDIERGDIAKQEEGKEEYDVEPPLPICYSEHSSGNCERVEQSPNGFIASESQHSYRLTNLNPSRTYKVTVTACVKGLVNGCGPGRTIFVETASKPMEEIIDHLQISKM